MHIHIHILKHIHLHIHIHIHVHIVPNLPCYLPRNGKVPFVMTVGPTGYVTIKINNQPVNQPVKWTSFAEGQVYTTVDNQNFKLALNIISEETMVPNYIQKPVECDIPPNRKGIFAQYAVLCDTHCCQRIPFPAQV